jgi:hypothetical protein
LVFSPDLFGGAFVFAPDMVDFRSLWLMDLYKDANAYMNRTEWREWPRPYLRNGDGNTLATVGDWAHLELAMGDNDRSGEYFAHQDATWGPQGANGYPAAKWDPITGEIDHAVADTFRRYDISVYLAENWKSMEPQLRGGRLKFFVTEQDNYYTNLAVHQFQQRLSTLEPASDAEFTYYPLGRHCSTPFSQEQLIEGIAKFMTSFAPARVDQPRSAR